MRNIMRCMVLANLMIGGCASRVEIPKVVMPTTPVYQVTKTSTGAPSDQKLKAMLVSYQQCLSYSQQLQNLLGAFVQMPDLSE